MMQDINQRLNVLYDRASLLKKRLNAITSTLFGDVPEKERASTALAPGPGMYHQAIAGFEEIYRVLDDCLTPIQQIENILYSQQSEGTAYAKSSPAPVGGTVDETYKGFGQARY